MFEEYLGYKGKYLGYNIEARYSYSCQRIIKVSYDKICFLANNYELVKIVFPEVEQFKRYEYEGIWVGRFLFLENTGLMEPCPSAYLLQRNGSLLEIYKGNVYGTWRNDLAYVEQILEIYEKVKNYHIKNRKVSE